ncbi:MULTISPECIES: hypothetical protein [unclassified Acidovorax]|nr:MULTISPECIES: hypothetical protein [unclassified Acidovorax]
MANPTNAPALFASNAMLCGFHFPFPAFGRLAASGNGYAFQPAA